MSAATLPDERLRAELVRWMDLFFHLGASKERDRLECGILASLWFEARESGREALWHEAKAEALQRRAEVARGNAEAIARWRAKG